jgi:hypothetical protein
MPTPALAALLAAIVSFALRADEGMWLLEAPPLKLLEERHAFRPTREWLERMQKSALRFETGGSGSFVSSEGLVLTNHHVASDMLAKLSTPQRDLLRDGFLAASRGEELKCPDLELRALWSVEDVTDRVNAAATPEMTPGEAYKARQAEMARIEEASQRETGLVSEVVTLYQGGRYHLYRYRNWSDVRLVFAPELQAASFGGDTDNFEFPRYALDACLLRVYENDEPLKPPFHLVADPTGASEGELTFVFGHPGRTERAYLPEHLRFLRDVVLPDRLDRLCRREIRIERFADRSAESARQAQDSLGGVANSRKAFTGLLSALQTPSFMADRDRAGRAAAEQVAKTPEALKLAMGAPSQISASLEAHRDLAAQHEVIERARGSGTLLPIARNLVRLAEERAKPSDQRLPEFRDGALPSLELELYSPAPIEQGIETQLLAAWLTDLTEVLGGDHPLVKQALQGKSPDGQAAALVASTSLADPEVRRRVASSGAEAIKGAKDGMLILAREIDQFARDVRTRYETEVLGPQRDAYGRLAAARFAAEGPVQYPDATFTLRMAFGPVQGYEQDGAAVAPFTTMAGLYERSASHAGRGDFSLTQRWIDGKSALDLSTPYNFVSTADIIGGNSGSPVVNQAGDLVGLIFDGNIQSLPWDYAYDDAQGRAVSVDIRAILEALNKVYGAPALAAEMTRRSPGG